MATLWDGGASSTFRAHENPSPNGTSEVPSTHTADLIAAAALNRRPRSFMSDCARISRSANRPVVNLPERGGVMDYKALVARVRAYTECPPLDNDALALGRWSLLDDGTEESCEVSYGDLRALCDAVEALEKDRHEGGRLVGFILDNRGKCFIPDEGNYWQRDAEDFVKRAASSRAPTASTPTPAAPSDA